MKQRKQELTTEEKEELKILCNQIWSVSQTRPDVSYETCAMSNIKKYPTKKYCRKQTEHSLKWNLRKLPWDFQM